MRGISRIIGCAPIFMFGVNVAGLDDVSLTINAGEHPAGRESGAEERTGMHHPARPDAGRSSRQNLSERTQFSSCPVPACEHPQPISCFQNP